MCTDESNLCAQMSPHPPIARKGLVPESYLRVGLQPAACLA